MAPLAQQAHGGGKERIAVGKVGGAVQGIHTPEEITHLAVVAALLRQHRNVGRVLAQHVQDGSLGCFIRVCNQVALAPLAAHREAFSIKVAQLLGARLGSATRHCQQGLGLGGGHGWLLLFQGDGWAYAPAAKVSAELELVDLVLILGFHLHIPNGPGNTQQTIALLPQGHGEPQGFAMV